MLSYNCFFLHHVRLVGLYWGDDIKIRALLIAIDILFLGLIARSLTPFPCLYHQEAQGMTLAPTTVYLIRNVHFCYFATRTVVIEVHLLNTTFVMVTLLFIFNYQSEY